MPRSVRPWKAWLKAMMAWRPVATRASLMAFSTASAPVDTSKTRLSPAMGDSFATRSHTATYDS